MKVLSMSETSKNVWSVLLDSGEQVTVFCREGQSPEDAILDAEPETQ